MPWPRPPRSAPTWAILLRSPHQPDGGLSGRAECAGRRALQGGGQGDQGLLPRRVRAVLPPPSTPTFREDPGRHPVVKGRYADSLEPEFEKTRRSWAPPPRATRRAEQHRFPQVAMGLLQGPGGRLPAQGRGQEGGAQEGSCSRPQAGGYGSHPRLQGHVYYSEVPAPAVPGYTSRPIPQFAASYQPAYLKMASVRT